MEFLNALVLLGLAVALRGVLLACTATIGTGQVGSMVKWKTMDWKSSARVGFSLQVCAAGVLQRASQAVACPVALHCSGEASGGSMVRTRIWAKWCRCERDSSYLTMAFQLFARTVGFIAVADLALLPKSTGRSWHC